MTPDHGDEADERQRRTSVNLLAAIAALLLAAAAIWLLQSLSERQKLQNCLESGRHDCLELARPADAR